MWFVIFSCQPQSKDRQFAENKTLKEWVILFDGSSTQHWRGYNMESLPDSWVIEGNELVFRPDIASGGLNIITKDRYQDFELRAEYNISEGGNSGIFHHVIEQDNIAIHWSGPEYQILDDAARPYNNDNQFSASLYDLLPADPRNSNPPGEWNTIRIISDGPKMEYWQNDEKVVEFERWTSDWYEMIRNSKFANHPSFGNIPKGHIGLQDHGDLVRFRNIKIRVLN
jgi:hypothetical protein